MGEEALIVAHADSDEATSSRRQASPSPDGMDQHRESITFGFRPGDIVSLPNKDRPSLTSSEVVGTLPRKRSSVEPTLPALMSHTAAEDQASVFTTREEVMQTSQSAPRLHGSRPISASATAPEVSLPGV